MKMMNTALIAGNRYQKSTKPGGEKMRWHGDEDEDNGDDDSEW